MKILKLLIIAILFTSCGSIVHYDYEKSTNFKDYRTYNYFGDMKTGLSELDTKRLIRSMDEQLKTMGLSRTDNPDFYIDIQSQEVQQRTNSNFGVGVGGTGRRVGGGVSVGIPVGVNKQSREIVIEFVDERKTGMFWQAIAESSFKSNASPEQRDAYFQDLVKKVLAKYPPKVKP